MMASRSPTARASSLAEVSWSASFEFIGCPGSFSAACRRLRLEGTPSVRDSCSGVGAQALRAEKSHISLLVIGFDGGAQKLEGRVPLRRDLGQVRLDVTEALALHLPYKLSPVALAADHTGFGQSM